MNTDLIPAGAARDHIKALIEGGSNQSRIARCAEVSRITVVHILHGYVVNVTRDTHEAIMRVRAEDEGRGIPAGHVDAVGSRRRARALIADGHTSTRIAMRAQVSLRTLWAVLDAELAYVPTDIAHRLERAFAVMQMTPGKSTAARSYAAARRWNLSWEWDEEDIDVRTTRPFPSSLTRRQEIADAIKAENLHGTRFRPVVIAPARRARVRSAA
ncbi:hypothetical protein [Nocardia sp. NPDC127526]|uniref:hypothetical protein n=1 Tax=Nocardia sp. NPDC127526 TaxID=3345393 RepID=UPI00363A9B77